jgi:predicted nucleic acid-binding protein
VNYLLDTNIISEIAKGKRRNVRVAAWYDSIDDTEIYLSVLVLGEIRKGLERARKTDHSRALALENWLASIKSSFAERLLPIDRSVADEWGRMSAKRTVSTIDALLAATAKINGMTLVTRNTSDIADLGVDFLNPFEEYDQDSMLAP